VRYNRRVRMTKSEWRVWGKEQRARENIPRLSQDIAVRVAEHPAYQNATQVLLYHPMPGEIDLLSLCQDKKKSFFLPRCEPEHKLSFHVFVPDVTPLIKSRFGINEPAPTEPRWSPQEGDLVIVPALLSDEKHIRLGYGGGYYDRFLTTLPLGMATLVALPKLLIVAELPRDTWDVPIKWIVTESN
jgi:5-formyltetrahydrofolate cyclo-ligase